MSHGGWRFDRRARGKRQRHRSRILIFTFPTVSAITSADWSAAGWNAHPQLNARAAQSTSRSDRELLLAHQVPLVARVTWNGDWPSIAGCWRIRIATSRPRRGSRWSASTRLASRCETLAHTNETRSFGPRRIIPRRVAVSNMLDVRRTPNTWLTIELFRWHCSTFHFFRTHPLLTFDLIVFHSVFFKFFSFSIPLNGPILPTWPCLPRKIKCFFFVNFSLKPKTDSTKKR